MIIWLLLLAGCASTHNLQPTKNSTSPKKFYKSESPNDSGMWLLPQIKGAVHSELAAKGLRLPAQAFYDSTAPSLNQAIVRVNIGEEGGGSGSFVSDKGLVLTNHHIAYDAIASISSAKENYLSDGFYAKSYRQEIPLPDYTFYITLEQKEITQQINNRLADSLNRRQRNQMTEKIRQQIIQKRKGGIKDLKVQIDDYWSGNRQFMTVYRVIQDVRLVYAPPESIGKYGGNVDNWKWPRHTGDYSFLRAYVAKDGSSKAYSKDNIPYHPARHLKINDGGLAPGDFTMVLGFPGRTYRHESSYAFQFYEDIRDPILIKETQAIYDALKFAADQNAETAVENASERANQANSLKYFRGIQSDFKKYGIVERKRRKEERFSDWLKKDSSRIITYRRVLPQLKQAYDIASQTGDLLYATVYPLNNNKLLQIASTFNSYQKYIENGSQKELGRAKKDSLLTMQQKILDSVNIDAQNLMLSEMLQTLVSLPDGKVPPELANKFDYASGKALKKKIHHFLNQQQDSSVIYSSKKARKYLQLPLNEAKTKPVDEMVRLYQIILEAYRFSRKNYLQHLPYLKPAQKRYEQGMLDFREDSTEYPDANFTLRLSGGRVQGYRPRDGIYYTPFTTLKGMLVKDTGKKPFNAPKRLKQYVDSVRHDSLPISPYATNAGQQIVNFLSTNDITGGNSGSPVLNAEGQLVGVAFDGNIEGVIGDYFYDPAVNRTINVDIRYILFIMNEFSGATRLLDEMDYVTQKPYSRTGTDGF